jgi:hypothetical protein
MAGEIIVQKVSDAESPDGFRFVERHSVEGSITTGQGTDQQVMHPWSITRTWTEEELNAVGIYRVDRVEPPPSHIITSYHFEMRGDKVVQVLETMVMHPPVVELPQPMNDMDAVTKRYVDEAIAQALQRTR